METVAWICVVLAAIPLLLLLLNLLVYRRLPPVRAFSRSAQPLPGISVLIPARNEETNIATALESALRNTGIPIEVIVLDDHSTDTTASIVQRFCEQDSRVRLESAPVLPNGWCGKQHACWALSKLARQPLLLFMDADVRLSPDALPRMACRMVDCSADLLSGVPRQQLSTFSEKLLIPLVHFVLLGFLPMFWARRTRNPAFAAGCGQLMLARADAYKRAGGHALVQDSLHDGLKLPREFRKAGLRTDLFDATDAASCRMYNTNVEVWRGLGKNAVEGMAAPGTIAPMTALLAGGQVLPWLLLAFGFDSGLLLLIAGSFGILARLICALRFHQPMMSAVLHPIGIVALLGIQWFALWCHSLGIAPAWRGRTYPRNASARMQPASGVPVRQ